ncbi:MAG: universal stress protein [Pseudomonadota bacterium]
MKSILFHASNDDAVDTRLQVALDLCRAFGAHLTCLYVTPYNAYIAFDPFGGMGAQGAILEGLHEIETELRSRIEARLVHEDVKWDWLSADGDVASGIVAASALSDLVVVSQHCDADKGLGKPLPIVNDVTVHSACAVLVVPKGVGQLQMGGDAVIGWNASPEAAHAIRGAMPFLKMASSVHLASVGSDGEVFPQTAANAYLSRHGISSDLHELVGSNSTAAQVLHDFAVSKQANCLIMGAYGHSRLRETLLGGVTRDLLATSTIPLLVAH